jgi:hypothetical protein
MVSALHKKQICFLYRPYGFGVLNQQTINVRKDSKMLLFLKYEFTVVYKLGTTHVITDALSKLLDNSKPLGVPNQIVDASLFSIEPIWMEEVKTYLKTS